MFYYVATQEKRLNSISLLTTCSSDGDPNKSVWENKFYQGEPLGSVTEIAVYSAARRVAVYSEATRTRTQSYGGSSEAILGMAEVVVYGQTGNKRCILRPIWAELDLTLRK